MSKLDSHRTATSICGTVFGKYLSVFNIITCVKEIWVKNIFEAVWQEPFIHPGDTLLKVSWLLLKGEVQEFGFGWHCYRFWGKEGVSYFCYFWKKGVRSLHEFFHFCFVDWSKRWKFYTRMGLFMISLNPTVMV